jgi:hypothetical protein
MTTTPVAETNAPVEAMGLEQAKVCSVGTVRVLDWRAGRSGVPEQNLVRVQLRSAAQGRDRAREPAESAVSGHVAGDFQVSVAGLSLPDGRDGLAPFADRWTAQSSPEQVNPVKVWADRVRTTANDVGGDPVGRCLSHPGLEHATLNHHAVSGGIQIRLQKARLEGGGNPFPMLVDDGSRADRCYGNDDWSRMEAHGDGRRRNTG